MARPWRSIEGIACQYGGRPVFRDVWFGVEGGEFMALIGHSGCGKTTILNILAGLEASHAGVMDGREVSSPALDRAVVFQSHALLPWLTALGNVAFAVRSRHRDWTKARVQEWARQMLDLAAPAARPAGDPPGAGPLRPAEPHRGLPGNAQPGTCRHASARLEWAHGAGGPPRRPAAGRPTAD